MRMLLPRKAAVSKFIKILARFSFSDGRELARVNLKRGHTLPREAHTVSTAQNPPQTMRPVRYETTI